MAPTEGKVIRCRAAVSWTPKEPLVIEEVEVFPPRRGEVRVKVLYAGICHSDVYYVNGRDPSFKFPALPGHESVAVVESVGEDVTSVKPGDYVIPLFTPQCKECSLCKSPETNLCKHTPFMELTSPPDVSHRFRCKGKPLNQLLDLGTFSQYIVVSEMNVAKITPKDAALDKLCLLGCCVPTGYGSAVKVAQVRPGSTCAVFGLGGVGISVVMGCKDRGAKRIIGVDVNADKFEIGKVFGCTEFVNPTDYDKPINEVLAEMTDGGVDYAFVSVGSLEVMERAFNSSHPNWGTTVIIGLADRDQKMSVSPWDFLLGRKLIGDLFGGWKTRDEIPKVVDLFVEGKLKLNEFPTKTLPLDQINDGIKLLLSGKILRANVTFE